MQQTGGEAFLQPDIEISGGAGGGDERSFLWVGGWRDIFWDIHRGALDLAGRVDRGWR